MLKNDHLRFLSQDQYNEAINFYHLARTALSGEKCGKYERMIWASKELNKKVYVDSKYDGYFLKIAKYFYFKFL